MELLLAIERSAPVGLLKASFYTYPLVNAGHVLSIGALVTGVILMDLRILGFLAALERAAAIGVLRRLALVAFCGAVLTGAAMFAIRASEYAFNPAFQLKMGLIVLAGANLLALGRLAVGPDGLPAESGPARILAVTSAVLWLGVLLCGRFIAFV